MPPMRMVHETDPAQDIMKAVGNLNDFELFANQVLLGVYQRPEKTKSGIILSDKTRAEDEHQGKAALVLKKGPQAFEDDDQTSFHGQNVSPGDWVSLWITDGRKIFVNGVLCRIVKDTDIRMRIPAPDVVY